MEKHTPKPWVVSSDGLFVVAGGDDGRCIACSPSGGDVEWSEADALLIAAAPDLLDALRLC